jgi:hypothetical protein
MAAANRKIQRQVDVFSSRKETSGCYYRVIYSVRRLLAAVVCFYAPLILKFLVLCFYRS